MNSKITDNERLKDNKEFNDIKSLCLELEKKIQNVFETTNASGKSYALGAKASLEKTLAVIGRAIEVGTIENNGKK